MIAGHLGLILEMAMRGDFKDVAEDKTLHSSTAKALLIHSARPYNFSGMDDDLNRFHQGWGFPDLRGLYLQRNKIRIVNESENLRFGESYTTELDIKTGDEILVTMSYRDPQPSLVVLYQGERSKFKADFPEWARFWGNYGLQYGNESLPGGVPDGVDTVERVIICA